MKLRSDSGELVTLGRGEIIELGREVIIQLMRERAILPVDEDAFWVPYRRTKKEKPI